VNEGLYSGVSAANAAERRLDAVASNLANLGAIGFKRRETAAESFDAVLRGGMQRQLHARETLDFSQGTLRDTGEPYDLALVGRGMFAVEGPRGELYTRDGRFHVDANGVLQTTEGFPVAWEGSRGTIDTAGLPVRIDSAGTVWQGETQLGRLRVVDFDDQGRLQSVGAGAFKPGRGAREVASTAQVRQGSLEQANVAAVDEMVELIAVQRSFESATRLLSMIDQSYQRLTTPSS
jgi:flagellar basal body rod protein FlgG